MTTETEEGTIGFTEEEKRRLLGSLLGPPQRERAQAPRSQNQQQQQQQQQRRGPSKKKAAAQLVPNSNTNSNSSSSSRSKAAGAKQGTSQAGRPGQNHKRPQTEHEAHTTMSTSDAEDAAEKSATIPPAVTHAARLAAPNTAQPHGANANGPHTDMGEDSPGGKIQSETSATASRESASKSAINGAEHPEEQKQLSLADVEKRKRDMEEENKRRQAELERAIKEKRFKALTEANKLKSIQQELSSMQRSLAEDIGILRQRIETASREYTQARKRYELAEQEFIAAKLDLHRKEETKEKLTEHLMVIIEKNEERKAAKLNELMEKLGSQ